MNSYLIKSFDQLVSDYRVRITTIKKSGDVEEARKIGFKIMCFNKTLKIIKEVDFPITDGEQLIDIKGIGKGVISRINDILSHKPLDGDGDGTINPVTELTRITGIGPAKALKLIEDGITLDKLRDGSIDPTEFLTHHQLIGLRYLDAIEMRIPHAEIKKMETILRSTAKKQGLEILICGSYRRNMAASGDIDVLVYNNPEKPEDTEMTLKHYITKLTQSKFLIDHLTVDGTTKYMGIAQYKKGTPRRIDIRYIYRKHVPTSMLYFTGSGDFNKNMRVYANKKGYKLNEYGLFDKQVGRVGQVGTVSPPQQFETEQDIFAFLGLDYVEPEARLPNFQFQ